MVNKWAFTYLLSCLLPHTTPFSSECPRGMEKGGWRSWAVLEQCHLLLVLWKSITKPLTPPEPSFPPQLQATIVSRGAPIKMPFLHCMLVKFSLKYNIQKACTLAKLRASREPGGGYSGTGMLCMHSFRCKWKRRKWIPWIHSLQCVACVHIHYTFIYTYYDAGSDTQTKHSKDILGIWKANFCLRRHLPLLPAPALTLALHDTRLTCAPAQVRVPLPQRQRLSAGYFQCIQL